MQYATLFNLQYVGSSVICSYLNCFKSLSKVAFVVDPFQLVRHLKDLLLSVLSLQIFAHGVLQQYRCREQINAN